MSAPMSAPKLQVFYVVDFSGAVASTRARGKETADALTRIAAESDASMIEVSFSGVEVASAPFMQEVVRATQELKDRAIYSCLNADVNATLTDVENWRAGSDT